MLEIRMDQHQLRPLLLALLHLQLLTTTPVMAQDVDTNIPSAPVESSTKVQTVQNSTNSDSPVSELEGSGGGDNPALIAELPGQSVDLPGQLADVLNQSSDLPAQTADIPGQSADFTAQPGGGGDGVTLPTAVVQPAVVQTVPAVPAATILDESGDIPASTSTSATSAAAATSIQTATSSAPTTASSVLSSSKEPASPEPVTATADAMTNLEAGPEAEASSSVLTTVTPQPIVFNGGSESSSQAPSSNIKDNSSTANSTTVVTGGVANSTSVIGGAGGVMEDKGEDNVHNNGTANSGTAMGTQGHGVKDGNGMDGDGLDLQTQLYIISGVYGGVLLLLIILVLILTLSITKLRDQLRGDLDRYVPADPQQIFAFDNGAFNGVAEIKETNNPGMRERSVDGDDLEEMGYTVYTGKTKEESYAASDEITTPGDQSIPMNNIRRAPNGSNPVMRYDEAVVPLHDGGGGGDRKSPRQRQI